MRAARLPPPASAFACRHCALPRGFSWPRRPRKTARHSCRCSLCHRAAACSLASWPQQRRTAYCVRTCCRSSRAAYNICVLRNSITATPPAICVILLLAALVSIVVARRGNGSRHNRSPPFPLLPMLRFSALFSCLPTTTYLTVHGWRRYMLTTGHATPHYRHHFFYKHSFHNHSHHRPLFVDCRQSPRNVAFSPFLRNTRRADGIFHCLHA